MESRSLQIRENIESIQTRIAAAAQRAGRAVSSVALLAVTKNVPIPDIRAAIEAGITLIGENKIQEAKVKFAQIGPAISWHMLGHLQTNKARAAAAIFDMVQSLDSPRAADALDKEAGGLDRQLDVLIEVNVGHEEQKFGIRPTETANLVQHVDSKKNLRLRGLMAMAPYAPDVELARPFFRALSSLYQELRTQAKHPDRWTILSMGMTHDFEVAIEEGATLVRIGTGIFASATGRTAH